MLFSYITECPFNIDLQTLPTDVTCHISNSCTKLECCVFIQELSRQFTVFLDLDTCSHTFTYGIENITIVKTKDSFSFGK